MSKSRRKRKESKSWIWLCSLLAIFFIFIIVCYGRGSLRANGSYQKTISSIAESIKLTPYTPPTLKSLIIHPDSSDNYFDFILDTADSNLANLPTQSTAVGQVIRLESGGLEDAAKELIDYFFLGITLPSDDLWVNLNSVRKGEITSPRLALTDIGKVLLEADLTLKRDCSRFTDPRSKTGKEYWDNLQRRLNEEGLTTTELPIGNRFWIVPLEAVVEEDLENNTVTIVKSKLKVCLEQEYLKLSHNNRITAAKAQTPKELLTQQICDFTMKETILPHIQERVNYAKEYAPLRQVYNSLILAEYYKQKYHNGQGLYPKLVNRGYIEGLESNEPWATEDFYNAYVKSCQEGEYRFAQTEYDPFLASMVKKYYFYGGILLAELSPILKKMKAGSDEAISNQTILDEAVSNGMRLIKVNTLNPNNFIQGEKPYRDLQMPSGTWLAKAETAELSRKDIEQLVWDRFSHLDVDIQSKVDRIIERLKNKGLTRKNVKKELRRLGKEAAFARVSRDNKYDNEKRYIYEPYIKGFENQTTTFMDSTKHDAAHGWIKDKVKNTKEWDDDYTLINIDKHFDEHDTIRPIHSGNWAAWVQKDKLVGEYRCAQNEKSLNELPESRGSVIVTIDLDFLIPSYSIITKASINNKVKAIVNILRSNGYNIKGLAIIRSPEWIATKWENHAYRKLAEGLEELFGPAKWGMRLQSISYYIDKRHMPIMFDNIGDNITSMRLGRPRMVISAVDLPIIKLALKERDPAIRIAAYRTLAEIGTPEAAQALATFIKQETNSDVIRAARIIRDQKADLHRFKIAESPDRIRQIILAKYPDARPEHIDLMIQWAQENNVTDAQEILDYYRDHYFGQAGFARISKSEDEEVHNLAKILNRNIDFARTLAGNSPFFLSGVPDSTAKACLEKLQEQYEDTRGKILTISFSDLVKRVKEESPQRLAHEFEGTRYTAFLVYGYRPFEQGKYTTEEAIKALSVLRYLQQNCEELSIGIMVFASSEYDETQFTHRQITRSNFPLFNFPLFFHYDGKKITQYWPRVNTDEPLQFAKTTRQSEQEKIEPAADGTAGDKIARLIEQLENAPKPDGVMSRGSAAMELSALVDISDKRKVIIDALAKALKTDESNYARAVAAEALRFIGPETLPILFESLKEDADGHTRAVICALLHSMWRECNAQEVVLIKHALAEALQHDSDEEVLATARETLEAIDSTSKKADPAADESGETRKVLDLAPNVARRSQIKDLQVLEYDIVHHFNGLIGIIETYLVIWERDGKNPELISKLTTEVISLKKKVAIPLRRKLSDVRALEAAREIYRNRVLPWINEVSTILDKYPPEYKNDIKGTLIATKDMIDYALIPALEHWIDEFRDASIDDDILQITIAELRKLKAEGKTEIVAQNDNYPGETLDIGIERAMEDANKGLLSYNEDEKEFHYFGGGITLPIRRSKADSSTNSLGASGDSIVSESVSSPLNKSKASGLGGIDLREIKIESGETK